MAQKINSEIMKRTNRNEILRLIRSKPLSRIQLAEKTGLTRASVSFICEDLIRDGLVTEGDKQPSIGGRRATLLCLNRDYGIYAGVHLTRDRYAAGVCDFAGEVLGELCGEVDPQDPHSTLDRIKGDLKTLLGKGRRLLGIGVAAPGPLDGKAGKLGNIVNFSGWRDLQIRSYFEREFGCRCVLDNFSNALAYAEFQINGSCEKRYLELIIDSGFGSAVATADGSVSLSECELGHTSVDMHGEKCGCGNIGCAELYVNEKKFVGSDREKDEFYGALASVIVNAVNTFSLSQVIFVGCVLADFKAFSEKLYTYLTERKKGNVKICGTALQGKDVFVACNLAILSSSL